MALTTLQRTLCRLLADHRVASGESYVAGAAALNELLSAPRLSRDLDLFHDSEAAVAASWRQDRALLEKHGFSVRVEQERPGYVEAEVGWRGESVRMEWARDSAFRFFPLMAHEEFGLVLHPFDLATNKVLALVGRLEVRDWIDVIHAAERLQPLGYLAWAASGKDPGLNPMSILEHAARTARYSAAEVAALDFAGGPPDAGDLSRRWRILLDEARTVVGLLPAEQVGTCVITEASTLYDGTAEQLGPALAQCAVRFHPGRIGGVLPALRLQP